MSFDLEGSRVVVTGAARGIGLAISVRFAELGAQVCGWDIRGDLMLSETNVFKHTEKVDVSDEHSVQRAYTSTLNAIGGVDVVVANAGVNGPTKPTWNYTFEEWQRVIDVDLTGVFLTTRAFLNNMRERGTGRLIVVASIAGKEGNPGACAYGTAKAGAIGYAKGLARELLPSGITVNCIAPAIAETDLLEEMSDDYIEDKRSRIPMKRLCSVQEIADMAAWVASPRCSFTTGQVFDLSGGRATY